MGGLEEAGVDSQAAETGERVAASAPPQLASPPVPVGSRRRTRAHRPSDVCPFLRDLDDLPPRGAAIENRCAAFGRPLTQSRRQQELVCLMATHRDCPRYLRGALVAPEAAVHGRGLPRATLAAALILLLAVGGTIAFSVARGGLDLAVAPSPGASSAASASASAPSPTARASASASTVNPSPTGEPSGPASPVPSIAPASISPLLVACSDRPACYLYRVQAGDSLAGIADRFGVPYGTVLRMNPELSDPNVIHVGQQVALPPPTR